MSETTEKGRRGPGRQFKPGESGNPGGRPKVFREMTELARSHTSESIDALVALMRESPDDRVRMCAAVALLDRGWGKPAQAMHVARITATVSEERVAQAFESAGALPKKQD